MSFFARADIADVDFWGSVDDMDATTVAQKLREYPDRLRLPNWGYRGPGGIMAHVVDLRRWHLALIEGKLLTLESVNALFGPHLELGSGTGIGYGWFTSTTARGTLERWSRGGEDFGHNAVLRWYVDEKALIIVASNAGKLDGVEANRKISDELEELIFSSNL